MVCHVSIRFYEELNDFLLPEKRKRDIECKVKNPGSIKDLIESLAVPHTEVDLILVNGHSVDFHYQLQDGDRISVYPVFELLNISPLVHLRPKPLRQSKFVLDIHLGRLAAYLRMMGFDCLYRNDYDDVTLARISVDGQRILLTCDRQLLMRKEILRGYFVRSRQPRFQLEEVIRYFDLYSAIQPFTRCMNCNGLIEPVEKSAIKNQLLPETQQYYEKFWQCPDCKKIYWKGSHYQRMQKLVVCVKKTGVI